MSDLSELDKKYFISKDKYNCPFCNMHSVVYKIVSHTSFNWSNERTVHIYMVQCQGCEMVSLHLSDYDFEQTWGTSFGIAPEDSTGENIIGFSEDELDKLFFYHQPTSFFTVNSLIPEKIRSLVSEADGCGKMNFLVGASGALRKAIYELLRCQGAEGIEYQDKIKWLKSKYPFIFPEYFDSLANIQDMASDNLHEKEGSWKPWSRGDFDYLLETIEAVLEEIYVKPEERKTMLSKITQLKSKSTFSETKAITSQ